MAITVEDIQNVSFSIDRKGYDVDEVDVFLERVADEVGIMASTISKLQMQLAEATKPAEEKEAPAGAPVEPVEGAEAPAFDASEYEKQIADLEKQVADLEDKLAEKAANDAAISQALIVAQRSADEVVAKARTEASNIIKDADEEADRIIGKAESDRLKITESIRQLEIDRTDVRAEYRDMLANFMEDAQKKLAEIDGDTRRAQASAQARADANADAYAPAAPVVSVITSNPADPAATTAAPAPVVAPSASGFIDKDLSGFGAADDDFLFDVD